MEALTLTREVYEEARRRIDEEIQGTTYIGMFECTFPEGINTASVMEICRVIQTPTTENKVRLLQICIAGKNVEVKCPNGDTEKFCMSSTDDTFDAFPFFQKEPLALLALADNVYGYILKKSVRLSKPKAAAAQNAE